MKRINKSQVRKLILQEYYGTSLTKQLYEQAAPTPADPAATAPAVDPTAGAAEAPAATAPAIDPAAAPAVAPAAAPAVAPAAIAAPAAAPAVAPAVPAIDPTAAAAAAAGAAAAMPPTLAPGTPATPAAAPQTTAPPKPETPPEPGSLRGKVEDAASDALAAASSNSVAESLHRRSLKFLIEQETEEPAIDISVYASKLANLIKNYTSLVDVKKNVIDQANRFLDGQFPKKSENLKKQLADLLRKDHHISLKRPEPPPDSYAVGAKSGSGGAA